MRRDQLGLVYWSDSDSTGYLRWPEGTEVPQVGSLVRFRGRIFRVLEVLARRSTDRTPVLHVKVTRMIDQSPSS